MAQLALRCKNCGRVYSWATLHPTYVGRPGQVEFDTMGNTIAAHPSCPDCTSQACTIISQG